jgi:hypothetical protein
MTQSKGVVESPSNVIVFELILNDTMSQHLPPLCETFMTHPFKEGVLQCGEAFDSCDELTEIRSTHLRRPG